MNQFESIYSTNTLLIGFVLLVLMLLATEAGFRIGAGARARRREEKTSYLDFIQGSVLGLLSLLLGFTYAYAADRHDVRKQLLVREANALGAAYLRAGLLTNLGRSELRGILRQYVDAAAQPDDAIGDRARSVEKFQQAEQVLLILWPAAARAIEGREPTEVDSLLLQSVNDVIDLHEQRLAAFEDRVLVLILGLLFFPAGPAKDRCNR